MNKIDLIIEEFIETSDLYNHRIFTSTFFRNLQRIIGFIYLIISLSIIILIFKFNYNKYKPNIISLNMFKTICIFILVLFNGLVMGITSKILHIVKKVRKKISLKEHVLFLEIQQTLLDLIKEEGLAPKFVYNQLNERLNSQPKDTNFNTFSVSALFFSVISLLGDDAKEILLPKKYSTIIQIIIIFFTIHVGSDIYITIFGPRAIKNYRYIKEIHDLLEDIDFDNT